MCRRGVSTRGATARPCHGNVPAREPCDSRAKRQGYVCSVLWQVLARPTTHPRHGNVSARELHNSRAKRHGYVRSDLSLDLGNLPHIPVVAMPQHESLATHAPNDRDTCAEGVCQLEELPHIPAMATSQHESLVTHAPNGRDTCAVSSGRCLPGQLRIHAVATSQHESLTTQAPNDTDTCAVTARSTVWTPTQGCV